MTATKRCPRCQRQLPLEAFTRNRTKADGRRSWCKACERATRPSMTERGYGPAHQRLRRRVARQVAAGGALCARCGQPIEPGQKWDLGHDDQDRSFYTGPEHQACNRATAGRRPPPRRHSRRW